MQAVRPVMILLGYPERFAPAALANEDVQENIRIAPNVWTIEGVTNRPPCRWEFDVVTAFGGPAIASWARNKSGWGELLTIEPLRPDDPVDLMFLCCIHKPDSPYRKRLEQKLWMKDKLGRGNRGLVTRAGSETKENFVGALTTGVTTSTVLEESSALFEQTINAAIRTKVVQTMPDGRRRIKCWIQGGVEREKAALIRERLRMTPEEFWQHAHGKPIPEERMRDPQRYLFEDEE
jgi:hypothetical protein